MTEDELTTQVREYLNKRGIHYFKHWSGGRGGRAFTKKGISDIICCYRGRYVAMELKATGKQASLEQLEFLESVYASDGSGGVFDNMEEIVEMFWTIDKIIDC